MPWREQFEQLTEALAEWSDDEPLRGLPESSFGMIKCALREERLEAVYSQLEAGWRAGEEKWLYEETEKLHKRVPGRSKIFEFYLLARAGELSRTRLQRLIREWTKRHGEPGHELRHVMDQVSGRVSRSRHRSLPPVPDQLPARERSTLGRDALIHDLAETVRKRHASGSGTLVVLSGLAGIGKSTVAHRLAETLRDRFPDGILYADLRGFAGDEVPPTDPEHLLDRFLAELLPYSSVTGLEGKSAALRSALADRSVLLVLDDAWSAQQVRPLLPGTGRSAVIVTSRTTLGGLRSRQDAVHRTVEALDDQAAADILMERLSGAERRKYAAEIRDIVRLCDNHPLALTVVARRLEARPLHTIHGLVRELAEERHTLDALHLPEHELSVRMALACSERALSAQARRLLWQLAVHPGPTIGWDAVLDLGLAGEGMRADRAVEELAAASLVELQSDRYRLHDLVRAFAGSYVDPGGDGTLEDFRAATVRQVLEHQLQNVRACDRLLDGQRMLPVGDPDGVTVHEPGSLEEAMAALDTEYDTVLRGIELAHKQGLERYVWLLPMALVTYQWRRHHLADALRWLGRLTDTAEVVVSCVDRAMVHRMLAGTHWRLEQYSRAEGYLRRAVLLSEQDDTRAGLLSLAHSLNTLAVTLRKQGSKGQAEEQHRRALELYRSLRDRVGEAAALNGIGTLHYDRAEYDEALRFCADALHVVEGTADRNGRADVLYTLAKIHLARSERNEALTLFRQACDTYRELDHWPNENKVLWVYADALVAAGRSGEAVEVLERVLVLRERMGGADAQEVRDRLEALR